MTLRLEDRDARLYLGDAATELAGMEAGLAACCITSPPYLDARPDYPSPSLEAFGAIFRQLRRVVSGVALVNVGRVFRDGREVRWHEPLLAVIEEAGWLHLDTFVWCKPNANPIRGRVFADSHETVYVLGGQDSELNVDAVRTPHTPESIARYNRAWTNHGGVKGEAGRRRMREPLNPLGARPRSYREIHIGREKGNPHPAPMALDLADYLVRLGSWPGDTVLDPFVGSGTTMVAARKHERSSVGIDLSAHYLDMAAERLKQQSLFA